MKITEFSSATVWRLSGNAERSFVSGYGASPVREPRTYVSSRKWVKTDESIAVTQVAVFAKLTDLVLVFR
jgi:hypothetical protein